MKGRTGYLEGVNKIAVMSKSRLGTSIGSMFCGGAGLEPDSLGFRVHWEDRGGAPQSPLNQ